jgi:UDP-N-acetylglucosamine acyltransferase
VGANIHPTALVDASAQLGDGVAVGPHTIIEAHARIGAGTIIESQVVIKERTIIGEQCHLFVGAVLGHLPQDARYRGEGNRVVIGNHNVIREYTTIHRATMPNADTSLGDHNMIMAYVHIGHDCQIGNHVYIASYAGISGHVTLEDLVNVGGMAGFHQFVHVGKMAMVGGMTKVNRDIPPFMMADGHPMEIVGLNTIGLRRGGVTAAEREALKQCYKLMYRAPLNTTQALERIEQEVTKCAPVEYLIEFLRRIPEGRSGRQDQGR